MKTSSKLFVTVFAIAALLFTQAIAQDCMVNIPDANFKSYLLSNNYINTNGDGAIQCSEASAYTGTINAVSLQISDLTGIEAFTKLLGLECDYNQLTSLNVSANINLDLLSCNGNKLTSLDVSANSKLRLLDCMHNELTSLILPSSGTLTYLRCHFNKITNLQNLNNNSNIVTLACGNNQLESLDLFNFRTLKYFGCNNNLLKSLNMQNGYNNIIQSFYAINNPDLTCIQVDNPDYSSTNWTNGTDSWASFSTNCNPTEINCSDYRCGNKNEKVLICHLSSDKKHGPQTLCVDTNALSAHLAHGDICGPCDAVRMNRSMEGIYTEFLLENYPNPFYGKSTINFSIPQNDHVKIEVYDFSGNLIQTLFDSEVSEGQKYQIDFWGNNLPEGLYMYKLITTDNFYIRKMLLLKDNK